MHVQHDCNTGESTIIEKREFLAIKPRPSGRISATGVGLHTHAAHGPPARDHSGVGGGQLHDGLRHESSRFSFYKAGFSPPPSLLAWPTGYSYRGDRVTPGMACGILKS